MISNIEIGKLYFSSGLASNAARYIQETLYMRFIPRSVLALCLLIGVHNLHAKSEGYEADIPAERIVYTVRVNADGSDIETKEVTYLARTQIAVESISQADIIYNSSTQKVADSTLKCNFCK